MNLKIKIITGFNQDQKHTVDASEAHKAYYLFLHPDKRGVFKDGLALTGKHITAVLPDYNATMGWNPTYNMNDDDWNEVKTKGVDVALKKLLEDAKIAAYAIEENPQIAQMALQEIDILSIT